MGRFWLDIYFTIGISFATRSVSVENRKIYDPFGNDLLSITKGCSPADSISRSAIVFTVSPRIFFTTNEPVSDFGTITFAKYFEFAARSIVIVVPFWAFARGATDSTAVGNLKAR